MEESVIEEESAPPADELGDTAHGSEPKGEKGHLIVWQVALV